jgi:signal transduction histidine kinase
VRVAIDVPQLERLLAGLLENALERTPAGGQVALAVEEEPEALLFTVIDGGSLMSVDACEALFSDLPNANPGSNAAALRLHFCRITAESCGGEIGCAPADRGSSFWVRLPRSGAF